MEKMIPEVVKINVSLRLPPSIEQLALDAHNDRLFIAIALGALVAGFVLRVLVMDIRGSK